MPVFLQLWLTCFLTLGAAVRGLTFAYRILGSDLGTQEGLGGFGSEVVVALVASALQALVLWAAVAVIGTPHLYHFVLAAVVAGFVYMATHLEDMTRLEAGIIGATQFLLYLLAWLFLNR